MEEPGDPAITPPPTEEGGCSPNAVFGQRWECQGKAAAAAAYGCGWYRPYPAALANSAAALSAARFRRIRLMLLTEGAVAFVQTPRRTKKNLLEIPNPSIPQHQVAPRGAEGDNGWSGPR